MTRQMSELLLNTVSDTRYRGATIVTGSKRCGHNQHIPSSRFTELVMRYEFQILYCHQ